MAFASRVRMRNAYPNSKCERARERENELAFCECMCVLISIVEHVFTSQRLWRKFEVLNVCDGNLFPYCKREFVFMVHILCFVCCRLRYTILLIRRLYNNTWVSLVSAIKRLCCVCHKYAFVHTKTVHSRIYVSSTARPPYNWNNFFRSIWRGIHRSKSLLIKPKSRNFLFI